MRSRPGVLGPAGLALGFAPLGHLVSLGDWTVTAAAAPLMPDPAGFVTRTLPFPLRSHDRFVRLYEASPVAVLPRLGVPSWVAVPARPRGGGRGSPRRVPALVPAGSRAAAAC
ncbi:hypothetical protein [Streptomyces sp. NPDC091209]|uniref:hypothetical protein n=1 Tax=Streptomyces sp. NPDC091209 TaxID=3365974 RepID=UPI0038250C91